jgi:hypothetical protein
MKTQNGTASLFLSNEDGSAMNSPAPIPSINDSLYAAPRETRDSVVMQAITNVTRRQIDEGWWNLSPGGRTHVIYDEIRRLDQARVSEAAVSAGEYVDNAHN